VLGSREPLIAYMMKPVMESNTFGIIMMIVIVFTVVPVLAMMTVVLIYTLGVNRLPLKKWKIFLCFRGSYNLFKRMRDSFFRIVLSRGG